MTDLAGHFTAHWRSLAFKQNAGKLLLALSGGLDSMTLAQLLLSAKIPFAAAHCNFGLRGAASEGDERFVLEWCEAHGIECHVKRFDIRASEGSTQMAARSLRYEWFDELVHERHYAALLTAHHADDVAETVLLNLARGTGLADCTAFRSSAATSSVHYFLPPAKRLQNMPRQKTSYGARTLQTLRRRTSEMESGTM